MKVGEVMIRNAWLASPDQSLREVAAEMERRNLEVLPVRDRDHLVGMITNRDIALRGISHGLGPEVPVGEVMSAEIRYCREDDEIEDVTESMAHERMWQLPVLNEDKQPVGYVSLRDLAGSEPRVPLSTPQAGESRKEAAVPSATVEENERQRERELRDGKGSIVFEPERRGVHLSISWLEFLYFSFRGRVARYSYWEFLIGLVVIIVFIEFFVPHLLAIINVESSEAHYRPIWLIAAIIIFWPFLAIVLKRVHDFGASGWLLLSIVVALDIVIYLLQITEYKQAASVIATGVIALFIGIGCIRGTRGPNRYGPDPLTAL
jgi:uncharacterized membrane protein YhaH (DUF805 family)/CBS domain-containing protein